MLRDHRLTLQAQSAIERTQEIRLGVVMYGGVSLAIYTYGVARELADAVQDRSKAYVALKELLASDIVVDIVSGTSAGGVNGVLLGRALATGGSLASCAELWREKADLLALLDEPLRPVHNSEDRRLRALFRSEEAYEVQLEEALQKITHIGKAPGSPVRELDVFLTGTDLAGRTWKELDGRGRSIAVKDHRVVFHLKHRKEGAATRKSAFVGTNGDETSRTKGLAAIARVTSAFPVAFHPVAYDGAPTPETIYQELMKQTIRGEWKHERHFVDGGVLDNKPFTHALRPILFRATERPVERKIFYVDPDPESFGDAVTKSQYEPDQIAIAALTTLPRYETVADDLASIRAHNRRVRLINDLLQTKPSTAPDPETYLIARAAGIAMAIEAEISGLQLDVPFGERDVHEIHRVIVAGLAKDGTMLETFDVFREERRHLHAIYEVYEAMKAQDAVSPKDSALLEFLYGQLEKLEIAEDALRGLVRKLAREHQRDLLKDKGAFLDRLVEQATALLSVERKETTARALHGYFRGQLERGLTNENVGLLKAIRKATNDELATRETPLTMWTCFEEIDARIYPIQSASEILEKDVVELIRISPFDISAPRIGGQEWVLKPEDKISGDALFHFGGFVKRSWRSNDIFWGRMDASGILIDSLLDEKRLMKLADSKRLGTCVESASRTLADAKLISAEEMEALQALKDGPPAELAAKAKEILTAAAAREIFLSAAPDVYEDQAIDAGILPHVAGEKRRSRAEDLEARREDGDLAGLEELGKNTLGKLGSENLGNVAPDRVVRLASQTAWLLLRMLRYRFDAAGSKVKLVGGFFMLLERIAAASYILARAMELGLAVHAMLLIAIGALLVGSAVMMFFASVPFTRGPVLLLLALTGTFLLIRWLLVLRLRRALEAKER